MLSKPLRVAATALALCASTGASAATLYLCKAYNGGTFWASAPCAQYKALIERIESVPDGLPFDQQVNLAEQSRSAAAVSLAQIDGGGVGADGCGQRQGGGHQGLAQHDATPVFCLSLDRAVWDTGFILRCAHRGRRPGGL
jgi:hypothetical protein